MKNEPNLEEMIAKLNETMVPYFEKKIVKDKERAIRYGIFAEGVIDIKFKKGVDLIEAVKLLPSSSEHYFALDFSNLGMGDEKAQELLALIGKKKVKLAMLNLSFNFINSCSTDAICDFIANTKIISLSIRTWLFDLCAPELGDNGCKDVYCAAVTSPTLLNLDLSGNDYSFHKAGDYKKSLLLKHKRALKDRCEREANAALDSEDLTKVKVAMHPYVSGLKTIPPGTVICILKRVVINFTLTREDIEQIVEDEFALWKHTLIDDLYKINVYANKFPEELELNSGNQVSVADIVEQAVIDLVFGQNPSFQEKHVDVSSGDNKKVAIADGDVVPINVVNDKRCTMKDEPSLENMIEELNESMSQYRKEKIVKDEKTAMDYGIPAEGVIDIKFKKGVDLIEAVKLLPASSEYYFVLDFSNLGISNEKAQELLLFLSEKKTRLARLVLNYNNIYKEPTVAVICDFIKNTEILSLSICTSFFDLVGRPMLRNKACCDIFHASEKSATLLCLCVGGNDHCWEKEMPSERALMSNDPEAPKKVEIADEDVVRINVPIDEWCPMKDEPSLEEMIAKLNESMAKYVILKIVKDEKRAMRDGLPAEGVIDIKFKRGSNIIEAINVLPASSRHYFSLGFSNLCLNDEKVQGLLLLLSKKNIKLASLNLNFNYINACSTDAICKFIMSTKVVSLSLRSYLFESFSEKGCKDVCHAAVISPTLLHLDLDGRDYPLNYLDKQGSPVSDDSYYKQNLMFELKHKRALKTRYEKEAKTRVAINQKDLINVKAAIYPYVGQLREINPGIAICILKRVVINFLLTRENIGQIIKAECKPAYQSLIEDLSQINVYANKSQDELELHSCNEVSVSDVVEQAAFELVLEEGPSLLDQHARSLGVYLEDIGIVGKRSVPIKLVTDGVSTTEDEDSVEKMIEKLNVSMDQYIKEEIAKDEEIAIRYGMQKEVIGIKFKKWVDLIEAVKILPSLSEYCFALDFSNLGMHDKEVQQLLMLLSEKKVKLASLDLSYNYINPSSTDAICDFIVSANIMSLSVCTWLFDPCKLGDKGCGDIYRAAVRNLGLLYLALDGNAYSTANDSRQHKRVLISRHKKVLREKEIKRKVAIDQEDFTSVRSAMRSHTGHLQQVYPGSAAYMIREVAIKVLLTEEDINQIVRKEFGGWGYPELVPDLFEINSYANKSSDELGLNNYDKVGVANIVEQSVLELILEEEPSLQEKHAEMLNAGPKKVEIIDEDFAKVKAMVSFYVDTLKKYPQEASYLIKKVAISTPLKKEEIKTIIDRGFAGKAISESDSSNLTEDLFEINDHANKSPVALGLKKGKDYDKEDMANIVEKVMFELVLEEQHGVGFDKAKEQLQELEKHPLELKDLMSDSSELNDEQVVANIKLLIQYGTSPEIMADAINVSLQKQYIKTVECLLKLFPEHPVDMNKRYSTDGWNGQMTAAKYSLINIARKKCPEAIPLMIKYGFISPNTLFDGNERYSCLHLMVFCNALRNSEHLVETLIQRGIDPTLRGGRKNLTAYQWAKIESRVGLAENLKDYTENMTQQGRVELKDSIPEQDKELQQYFLNKLCLAIMEGDSVWEVGKFIASTQVDINGISSFRRCRPIDFAAEGQGSRFEFFELFLQKGARLISEDTNSATNILYYIASCTDKKAREEMLSYLENSGETLPYSKAHIAAVRGQRPTTKEKALCQDKYGLRPINYAIVVGTVTSAWFDFVKDCLFEEVPEGIYQGITILWELVCHKRIAEFKLLTDNLSPEQCYQVLRVAPRNPNNPLQGTTLANVFIKKDQLTEWLEKCRHEDLEQWRNELGEDAFELPYIIITCIGKLITQASTLIDEAIKKYDYDNNNIKHEEEITELIVAIFQHIKILSNKSFKPLFFQNACHAFAILLNDANNSPYKEVLCAKLMEMGQSVCAEGESSKEETIAIEHLMPQSFFEGQGNVLDNYKFYLQCLEINPENPDEAKALAIRYVQKPLAAKEQKDSADRKRAHGSFFAVSPGKQGSELEESKYAGNVYQGSVYSWWLQQAGSRTIYSNVIQNGAQGHLSEISELYPEKIVAESVEAISSLLILLRDNDAFVTKLLTDIDFDLREKENPLKDAEKLGGCLSSRAFLDPAMALYMYKGNGWAETDFKEYLSKLSDDSVTTITNALENKLRLKP